MPMRALLDSRLKDWLFQLLRLGAGNKRQKMGGVSRMVMFSTAAATMTNKDKIKYLKRYINLDREIDRKLEEVARLRAKLTRITQVLTAEPRGGGSIYGKTEEILVKIVDLEHEIDADVDRLFAVRDSIKSIIESVEDDRERLLLQYRYLDGKTFEKIAVEMNYSWRQIHRLHSRALTNLKMS